MSRRIQPQPDGGLLVLASAQTSLPNPPTAFGVVPSSWSPVEPGTVPEFDLELWAAADVTLTDATLLGAILKAGVIADDVVESVDTTANTLTLTSHGLLTGDGPVQMTTTGAVPGGLAVLTDYYVIRVSANVIQLATSRANALAGTAIDLSAGASGTNTIVDTSATLLVRWASFGLIEPSIALGLRKGYTVRCRHRPRVVAYAVTASLSGAVAVTAEVFPLVER